MRIVRTLSGQRNPNRQQKDPCSYEEPLLTEDGLWLEPIIAIVCKRDCIEVELLTEHGEQIIPLLVNDCYVAPPPDCEDRYLLTDTSHLLITEDGYELLSFACNPAVITYEAQAFFAIIIEAECDPTFSNQKLFGNMKVRTLTAAVKVRYVPFNPIIIVSTTLLAQPVIKNYGTPDTTRINILTSPVWHNFTYPTAKSHVEVKTSAEAVAVWHSISSHRTTINVAVHGNLVVPSAKLSISVRLETIDPQAHLPASSSGRISIKAESTKPPTITQPLGYVALQLGMNLTVPPIASVPLSSTATITLSTTGTPVNNIIVNDIVNAAIIVSSEVSLHLSRATLRVTSSVAQNIHRASSTTTINTSAVASSNLTIPSTKATVSVKASAITYSHSFMTVSIKSQATASVYYIDTSSVIFIRTTANTYRLNSNIAISCQATAIVKYVLSIAVVEVRSEVIANIYESEAGDLILVTCNASGDYIHPFQGTLDGGYYPLPIPPYPTYDTGDGYYPIDVPQDLKAIYDAASY